VRVALVTWDLGPPGSPKGVMSDLVLRGHERYEFVVVARAVQPELRPFVEWHRAPAPNAPFRLKWAVFFATAGARLAGVRADLIHAYGPAPMVPNRVDIASPNFDHADWYDAAGGRPPGARPLSWRAARSLTRALERWSYGRGRARLLDADSAGAKAALERRYPGVPVVVTPYTIDSERFHPDHATRARVRSELGAADGELVAVFVSRDWRVKRLDLAVAGLALARKRGHPLTLWVAGRDDVERLYAAADLLLLPTLYETFSRACHEAAATELPVVAPAVHGVVDLIGDDEAGIIVERDAESIADALSRLAADPELRARMGREGRARARRFPLERTVDRWLDLYAELARG